jgi:hypothetical protein
VCDADLEAGLVDVRRSPRERGTVELLVRRPAPGEREVLAVATLDPVDGLLGDGWSVRPCRLSDDGGPHPQMQLTLMNARVAALVAGPVDRWPLAGDQMFVDFDLSVDALPLGARLAVGTAVVEVTAPPHRGCAKFAARFGPAALRFVNSPVGAALRLRGVNTRVVEGGVVRPGDRVERVAASGPTPTVVSPGR